MRLPDAADAVLVGFEVARTLGLERGMQATLLATTPAGQQNAYPVSVRAEIEPGLPLQDKTFSIITLELAQKLLRLEGRVTEYAVRTADLEQIEVVKAGLIAELGSDYRVQTWYERDRIAKDALTQVRVVLLAIVAILAVLAATAIINTRMMSIHERMREIGTMLALGLRRRQIVTLLILEAGCVAILFAVIGGGRRPQRARRS